VTGCAGTLAASSRPRRRQCIVDMHWLHITRIAQALSVTGELDGATFARVANGERVWRLWREQDALASWAAPGSRRCPPLPPPVSLRHAAAAMVGTGIGTGSQKSYSFLEGPTNINYGGNVLILLT
jgi:hypothetical protein